MRPIACLFLFWIALPCFAAKVRYQSNWSEPTRLQAESSADISWRREHAEAWVSKHIGSYTQFLESNFDSNAGQFKDLSIKEDTIAPSLTIMTSLLRQAWLLKQQKKLTREQMVPIEKILANRQARYFDDNLPLTLTDNNVTYYRCTAYATALAPGRFRKMERHCSDFLKECAASKVLEPDNSTSRSSTALQGYIEMAIVAGNFDDLKRNNRLKEWLEIYRDMVAPNGSPPTYGASTLEGRVYAWPFIMEAGALLYDDPSMLYVADKLHLFHQTRPDTYHMIDEVRLHTLLPERTNTFNKMTPVAPKVGSVYLEKPKGSLTPSAEDDTGLPYKLILRTGHHPESSYVCMDIGSGYSSMIMQRAAIHTYSANGVNLLQGSSGRFLTQESSSVVMTSKGHTFPMMPDQFALKGFGEYTYEGPEDKDLNRMWQLLETPERRPIIDRVEVQDRGLDAYGSVRFERYGDKSGSLTRQLVLTPEGILVVRDELRPGRTFQGGFAGPLWIFGKDSHGSVLAPEAEGPNFFVQSGLYSNKLLSEDSQHYARMFVGNGLKGRMQKVGRNLNTVYVHEPIESGAMTFLSVLLPLGKEDAGEFAKTFKSYIPATGGQVAVRIPKAGGFITITVDRSKWQVTRSPGILIPPGQLAPASDEYKAKFATELATQLSGLSDAFAGQTISVKGRPVKVIEIKDGVISCQLGDEQGELQIAELPFGDQARLAFTLTKVASADPDAYAIAAFYLLALNKVDQGKSLVTKAETRGAEVKAIFGLR